MKWWGWVVILVLLVAHQDYWLWHDARLVFGFIPAGFAWHVGISLLAAAAWFAVVRWSWPDEIWALEEPSGAQDPKTQRSERTKS